jgi:hypothetical protein
MAVFGTLPANFPGSMAPIIKQSDDGERELLMRSWGFILLRDGYAPKRVTNTRDDKVQTKFWKNSFVKLIDVSVLDTHGVEAEFLASSLSPARMSSAARFQLSVGAPSVMRKTHGL